MKPEKEKPPVNKAIVDKAAAQKILRVVPFEQGFHFAIGEGVYTRETAVSLFSFFEELRTIDPKSIEFHLARQDFQKWIETTLGDPELESRINKLPLGVTDEELRKNLIETVQERLTELQTASNMQTNQVSQETAANSPKEGLKKFTVEELKKFDGQEGRPAYVAFDGKIYDVTNSSFWQGGDHLGAHQAGKDLTKAIKAAPHGGEVLGRMMRVGVLAQ